MPWLSARMLAIWRRVLALGWPIAVDQTLNTLMRTVDMVVTGLFSPAAVAAVGLADLYLQIPLRIGQALGNGAIAISSQDTGRGADLTRDLATTQALIIGAFAGLPIVAFGLVFSQTLIGVLGAESEVIRLGGLYLAIIFVGAPMRITGKVGGRALQGAGDTQTPMVVNSVANVFNIALTVGLGLGIWIAPRLGIVGVGIATVASRTFVAVAIVAVIASGRTGLALARPRSLTITRQLVDVSVPSFAEGMSTSLANFPFNAIVLLFGTEANAAYHIGRRIFQQLTAPLYRSFRTVSSIVVGQTLGEGKPDEARYAVKAILVLCVLTLSTAGSLLLVYAESIALIFTEDPTTLGYAVDFTRIFAISMPFIGVFYTVAGALRGAGDTRTPFYARFVAAFVIMLGGAYLLGVALGYGLVGIYVAIVLSHVGAVLVTGAGFVWGGWAEKAASMMAERAAIEEGD